MSPLRRSFLFFILALSVTSNTLLAQTPSGPTRKAPPPPPTPPATDQEQFVAYWTSETGWTSELQLRNNAVALDLIVTPVLRLADGAETTLAPVTLKPREVKSVDIDAAIAATSAPQLVGTYGSVALRYISPSAGTLYAAMMIRRTYKSAAAKVSGGSPKTAPATTSSLPTRARTPSPSTYLSLTRMASKPDNRFSSPLVRRPATPSASSSSPQRSPAPTAASK